MWRTPQTIFDIPSLALTRQRQGQQHNASSFTPSPESRRALLLSFRIFQEGWINPCASLLRDVHVCVANVFYRVRWQCNNLVIDIKDCRGRRPKTYDENLTIFGKISKRNWYTLEYLEYFHRMFLGNLVVGGSSQFKDWVNEPGQIAGELLKSNCLTMAIKISMFNLLRPTTNLKYD